MGAELSVVAVGVADRAEGDAMAAVLVGAEFEVVSSPPHAAATRTSVVAMTTRSIVPLCQLEVPQWRSAGLGGRLADIDANIGLELRQACFEPFGSRRENPQ